MCMLNVILLIITKFRDVFSKTHVDTLPTHELYVLKIELEGGATPLFSLIYLLSLYKL